MSEIAATLQGWGLATSSEARGVAMLNPALRAKIPPGSGPQLSLAPFLLKAFQSLLDRVEVREVARMVIHLGVLHDSFPIDDEGRTLGNTAHGEILVGEKALVGDSKCLGGLVFVITEERDANSLFLRPGRLCEGIVPTHPKNLGSEFRIVVEALRDGAKLLRADSGEGHRDEQQDRLRACSLFGESHQFGAVRAESGERKIWCLITYLNAHEGHSRDERPRVNLSPRIEARKG